MKMEKVEKVEKVLAILEKIIVTIPAVEEVHSLGGRVTGPLAGQQGPARCSSSRGSPFVGGRRRPGRRGPARCSCSRGSPFVGAGWWVGWRVDERRGGVGVGGMPARQ